MLIGGTGPKTLALAGEIADGVILDSQYTVARCGMRWATSRRVDPPWRDTVQHSAVPGMQRGSGCRIGRPYLDAGVDTLVFQPVGPQTVMPELITAVGDAAQRLLAR